MSISLSEFNENFDKSKFIVLGGIVHAENVNVRTIDLLKGY